MVRESRAPGGAVRRARCARRGRALVAHDLSKVTSRPRRALRASRRAAAPHVCAHTSPARGHTCLWVTTRGAFGAHSACVREGRGKAGAGAPAPLAPRPRRAEKRAGASGFCERKGFVQWPEACHTVVATEERLCLILALVVWTGALGGRARALAACRRLEWRRWGSSSASPQRTDGFKLWWCAQAAAMGSSLWRWTPTAS